MAHPQFLILGCIVLVFLAAASTIVDAATIRTAHLPTTNSLFPKQLWEFVEPKKKLPFPNTSGWTDYDGLPLGIQFSKKENVVYGCIPFNYCFGLNGSTGAFLWANNSYPWGDAIQDGQNGAVGSDKGGFLVRGVKFENPYSCFDTATGDVLPLHTQFNSQVGHMVSHGKHVFAQHRDDDGIEGPTVLRISDKCKTTLSLSAADNCTDQYRSFQHMEVKNDDIVFVTFSHGQCPYGNYQQSFVTRLNFSATEGSAERKKIVVLNNTITTAKPVAKFGLVVVITKDHTVHAFNDTDLSHAWTVTLTNTSTSSGQLFDRAGYSEVGKLFVFASREMTFGVFSDQSSGLGVAWTNQKQGSLHDPAHLNHVHSGGASTGLVVTSSAVLDALSGETVFVTAATYGKYTNPATYKPWFGLGFLWTNNQAWDLSRRAPVYTLPAKNHCGGLGENYCQMWFDEEKRVFGVGMLNQTDITIVDSGVTAYQL